jgi:hypothetical protein
MAAWMNGEIKLYRLYFFLVIKIYLSLQVMKNEFLRELPQLKVIIRKRKRKISYFLILVVNAGLLRGGENFEDELSEIMETLK